MATKKKTSNQLTPFRPNRTKVHAVLEKHGYVRQPHHEGHEGLKAWPYLGADCGDGWAKILDMTLTELEELDTKGTWKKAGAPIQQIKEKFGTLQIYASAPNEEGLDRLRRAEIFSALTCEKCGNVGVPRERGWILTLCPECTDTDDICPVTYYLHDRAKKAPNKPYAAVSIMRSEDLEEFRKWQEDKEDERKTKGRRVRKHIERNDGNKTTQKV